MNYSDDYVTDRLKDLITDLFDITDLFTDVDVLEYVKDHIDIASVLDMYVNSDLSRYFETSNTKVGDLFTKSEIIDFVIQNYDPDEIYTHGSLQAWAEDNGYVEDNL